MDEVGGALVAIALVLSAVFHPGGLHSRHLGAVLPAVRGHHRDATILSLFVSLTLSPALCALLVSKSIGSRRGASGTSGARLAADAPGHRVLSRLQLQLRQAVAGYGGLTRRLLRVAVLMLVVYAGLIGLAGWQFAMAPTGFIRTRTRAI